ncbi:MAG: type II secretion system protein GspD, partial [Geminicoccaceae bacterium]
GKREARIVADENNNSLLIRATPENFKKIQSAIQELDVQPVQVLLEATIAEVTLKDELSYGVQWFFQNGSDNITLSDLASGAVEQTFPGFSGIFSTNDKRVVFDALDSVSDVRIVSSPQLLVLDNQTAQLEVGDEVPIVTQQAQGVDGSDDRLINTIEQRQTGVILNVTPRVNASGLVVLEIQQEVSDVVQTTTSGIDSPTISQRRIGTSIAVGNRQTVALGGLIRDRTAQSQQGIPLLSSIPVLGSLFGTTNDVTTRTELLVLITPNVVRDHLEAQAVTDEFRRRFQAVTPLEQKLNLAK